MKLRRALCLCVGLSSAACGDALPKVPELPSGMAMDGGPDHPVGGRSDAGADDSGGSAASVRPSRVVSMAPSFLVLGDTYKYTPKTSTRARSVEMVGAPDGMSVDQGTVRWTPTAAQAGDHHVTMRVQGDTSSAAEQPINITVVKSTLRAEGDVDESGGSVHSQRPDATRVLGMGVSVPPRSLARGAHMSVSELEQAPATPNSQGKAVAAQFGPHGQVFDSAAYLTLALPTGVTHSTKRVGVYVYDPAGRWQRTPMVGIDLDNGLVTAKALHFSIYAAIQSSIDLDVTLASAGAKSTCQGALVGRAVVTSPLSEIELASVNNLSDSLTALVGSGDVYLQDLLGFPGFSGILRVVQVLDLVEPHGSTEVLRERKLTVVTFYVPGDGTATITHSDALGNVLAVRAYPQPALA
ncbi:MAG: hypothetical protein JWN04_1130, partial [Myxococcaceae bacterium]|nr:hypothetical protein [Myxococcaceae bacterium]